jgi:antitoxin (DNA-binding transcriptional repressor) of toxin-antitoxin stability system
MARLTPFEARRLAAILLFQAGRLERPPRFVPRLQSETRAR